jgi:hypothetical protein
MFVFHGDFFFNTRFMEFLYKNDKMVVLCGGLSKGQRPNMEVY